MSTSQPALRNAQDGGGLDEIHHYLGIIRKRKSIIVLMTIAVSCCALVVAKRLPNFYRSETVILVDAQQVPSTYVQSTVSTSIQDRLATIQQQVMSPTRLKAMIDKLGLFPELRGEVTDEALVATVQKSAAVEVGPRLSSFRIRYQAEDPKQAAAIANELAATFIAENLKVRQKEFSGTAEFLDNELQETKTQLEAREQQLLAVKASNADDLPESKQFHLESLNNLRMQLAASQDRVRQAKQDKMVLQSMMSTNAPTVDMDGGRTGGSGSSASPMQSQVEKLEARLADLRGRYGPNFPDVRKAQADLDRLKKQQATEVAQAPPPAAAEAVAVPTMGNNTKNPVIEAQLYKLDQDIEEQTKLQGPLQAQIDFHLSKLERVPVFQQQISGLMRDYDSLRSHYQSLLDKKLSAEMASELEMRQKGERFEILDPAPVPDQPAGPNRFLISFGGLMLGLVGGVGLAIVIEMMDQSVRSEHEATQILGLPVLAGIPQLYTAAQLRSRRMKFALATVVTAAVSSGLGLLISVITRKIGVL